MLTLPLSVPCRDAIARWASRFLGLAAAVISTPAELAAAKQEKVMVLGYFPEFVGEAHEEYNKLALNVDGAEFFKTNDSAIAREMGMTEERVEGTCRDRGCAVLM